METQELLTQLTQGLSHLPTHNQSGEVLSTEEIGRLASSAMARILEPSITDSTGLVKPVMMVLGLVVVTVKAAKARELEPTGKARL